MKLKCGKSRQELYPLIRYLAITTQYLQRLLLVARATEAEPTMAEQQGARSASHHCGKKADYAECI